VLHVEDKPVHMNEENNQQYSDNKQKSCVAWHYNLDLELIVIVNCWTIPSFMSRAKSKVLHVEDKPMHEGHDPQDSDNNQ
jgi:hypothetical protein